MRENKPKQCIIIGGGSSIQEGLDLGLKDKLNDTFSIACNYAFYHFPHTLTTFIDKDFYKPSPERIKLDQYIDISSDLQKESLIIGGRKNQGWDSVDIFSNTILVPVTKDYCNIYNKIPSFYIGNCNEGGLCGVFTLSLAIYLLQGNGTIFLLGFDFPRTATIDTHYYKNIKHRGVGWTKFYENNNPNKIFKPFQIENNINIYNVSINSSISLFPKISYKEFFHLYEYEYISQDQLRKDIKCQLTI